MCRVGGVGGDCYGYDRLLALAAPALREAVVGREVSEHALVLALPTTVRPDEDPRLATTFAADLCARASVAIDPKRVTVLRTGHAGGVEALRIASEQLANRPGVVVGGVDSYYHPEVLSWLDAAYRLHGLGVDDGFIPAEGAAFVVLERGGDDALAQLVAVHCAQEPAMLDESLPNIAEALTSLVKQVDGTGAKWVIHDANGEHVRQREWGMVALRHDLRSGKVMRMPNELGDLGAATAPMMAAIAATWWKVGCAPASRVLLLASSETAERAACVLEEVSS
jgi:3-oxoacyl-[acyl-carrier-protein] synthase-1